jgi:hypothetical protein
VRLEERVEGSEGGWMDRQEGDYVVEVGLWALKTWLTRDYTSSLLGKKGMLYHQPLPCCSNWLIKTSTPPDSRFFQHHVD